MINLTLDERTRMVLNAVISYYIATADPVGSRTLWKNYSLGFSPATLRNIMADLEDMGLLQHPHTSAGRVPTEMGYRCYVDFLVKQEKLREARIQEYLAQLSKAYSSLGAELDNMFENISRLLSTTSKYIGVVLAPRLSDTVFKRIDFIRLRDNQILVIFVSMTGMVQQRVIEVKEAYTQEKLDKLARCLNDQLKGQSLSNVREKFLSLMAADKNLYDRLLAEALQLSKEILNSSETGNVYIEGKLNILNQPEFADVEKMKNIFHAFEEKHQILHILDNCMSASGLQILIGSETEAAQMRECSMVTATYRDNERVVGALGVIGPTRMEYSVVIPLVEYTAQIVTEMLTKMDLG